LGVDRVRRRTPWGEDLRFTVSIVGVAEGRAILAIPSPLMSDLDVRRLASHRTIDLTTFGRRTGRPSRIEIWWFHFDERFIITGTPGRRDWFANVAARPEVVIHLEDLDLPATALIVTDRAFRHRFFTHSRVTWYRSQADLSRLVDEAPMIEVLFANASG
jgi:deazaflavin-dependent oxidoreductase (nitroreductase family)